jgi:DHA2 family multidrug resistance protein-like MFS transporter
VAARSRWAILLVLAAALALISLDNTIVNVALPTLQEELGATTAELQWVVDAYSVIFAGTLLLAGSLGDRFGRRRALVIGLVIFGAGSLAAGFATSADMLIACRAVMGIGGAFIMPSTLSILVQVFTEPRERAQAIGIWAAVAGAAVAIGPILGGLLLEVTTWHAIFWVNPPLVVLALLATLTLVPESCDPSRPRLDPLGAALSTVGIIAFVITVIEVPDQGISTVTIGSAVAAIVFITAFVWWERRAPRPLLPMALFSQRLFTVAIITVALVYGALMGVMFFLPQFLQLVQGDSPLQSGVAMLPAAGGLFLASLFSPRWAERFGTRRIVVSGLLLVVVGLSLAAYLTADSAYIHVGASLGLMGLGLGMVLPQATNAVLASVPRERAGMGSAVNDGVGELGGSLGVAILGSLLSLGYRNEIEAQIAAAGDAIASIPTNVVEAVRESLAAGSLAVAQLPADMATPIRQVAGNAFVSGMTTALMIAAAIVAVGAFLAWRMFPARVDRVEE